MVPGQGAFASMGEARRIAFKIAEKRNCDWEEVFEKIKDMSRTELETYCAGHFYTNVKAKKLNDA